MSEPASTAKIEIENKIENNIENPKILVESRESDIEIKKKKDPLSHINSETAKNGYKEEALVCIDLTNETIKTTFSEMLGDSYGDWEQVSGTSKVDIQSKIVILDQPIGYLKAQVKKYKDGQFQQIDRHWVDALIKYIPELNEVAHMLKGLCERSLLSNGTHVDPNTSIKKLSRSNYSQEELDKLVMELNKYKRQILNYAFLGTNTDTQPEYLIGVGYVAGKRTKITILKIKDVIDYLETLDFKISNKETVIKLGNDSILSFQRKGGDGGKKGSNQLQIKIVVSKIVDKVYNLQHNL